MSRPTRHKWNRDDGFAKCVICGLEVETRRIKRGGLPKCYEVLEQESIELQNEVLEQESIELQNEVLEQESNDFYEKYLKQDSVEFIAPEKKSLVSEYISYYRRGVERYGLWWIAFTFSMLALATVFLIAAIILFIFYGG